LRQIFVSPNGIRAGWRFLIFLALFLFCFFCIGGVVYHLPAIARLENSAPRGTLTPLLDFAFLFASISAVFLAAFVMSQIEKRPFRLYGIPLKGAFGKLFWQGAVWGLALESIEMLLIYALGGFSFGALALAGPKLAQYAVEWAVVFILVGINEEFTFRGYAQFTLTTGMGFWPAAVLLSVLFGAAHLRNPNEAWVGALSVMMFGLFLAFTLKRTGNLWFAIGFHAAADYAETFIYSVPDSGFLATGHLLNSSFHGPRWLTGGSIGPEASVFVFVLLGLSFPVFAWLYPGKPRREALS
jgi:membrane protease YdiL (CAAX protease family)